MLRVNIDWDKAHKNTVSIRVGSSEVIEKDVAGNALRKHTLTSLFVDESLENPKKANKREPVPAPQPYALAEPQPPMPQPCAPGVESEPVKLDQRAFDSLLAELRAIANDQRGNAKPLTGMQIHERLLAMKVHK